MPTSKATVPRVCSRVFVSALLIAVGVSTSFADIPSLALPPEGHRIGPGPLVMSEEEAALVADVDAGQEHAVVLVDHKHKESLGLVEARVAYHRRVKILSDEALELANIQIPMNAEDDKLHRFWVNVLCPGVTAKKYGKSALEKQVIASDDKRDLAVYRMAVPGVDVGCVLDYGFEFEGTDSLIPAPVSIQQPWPVRDFYFRWRPFLLSPIAFIRTGSKDLAITVTQAGGAIEVIGKELPALEVEAFSPPPTETHASLIPYLDFSFLQGEEFWDGSARSMERRLADFCGTPKHVRGLLMKTGIMASGDKLADARRLYAWIDANIENRGRLSAAEKAELRLAKRERKVDSAKDVIKRRRGRQGQIDYTFTCLARSLHIRSHIVAAVDRRFAYFKPHLHSTSQFHAQLVELEVVDPSTGQNAVVAPGSGLPFGEIPWMYTGLNAFKATKNGAENTRLGVRGPEYSVIRSEAELRFVDDNEAVEVSWSRKGQGYARAERSVLRTLPPNELADELRSRCGHGADFEVSEASAGDLEPRDGDYALNCKGELLTDFDDADEQHRVSIAGAWLSSPPALLPGERRTPVVFSYPLTHDEEIRVHAPEGYTVGALPQARSLSSPHGSYSLIFQRVGDAVIAQRYFVLSSVMVAPTKYGELAEFLGEVRRADSTEIEFVRAPD